ncbi:MAG TPA: hypothetical protein VLA66_08620, partial [Thermoanaerobaculia bacterium]|nr:hypothetical protein [Thermoanaerobaculia bacterium]
MAINRDKVLDAAEKMVARGRIESAISEYRKLLTDNPKDIALLNKVGDLYIRISRNDEAVRLFLQLAARYSEDGFFVKAIAIYKKILKFDPTRLVVYEKLAELYHRQGLVNEARSQYQVLVDYHHKHGDAKSATAVLEKMAELDPEDPTPRVRLAEAFHTQGNRQRELEEYRALAELMMRHERFEEAGQVYARAIAAAPEDLAFMTDAVLGLKEAGQVGAAARLLSIAVEKNPQAEKIARLAGLGRETTGAGVVEERKARQPTGELRVRDLAKAPAEVEEREPELGVAEAAPDERDFVVELPELEPDLESGPSTEIQPTEGMLERSPDSPWYQAESAEVEFELELESVEAEAAAPESEAGTAPDIEVEAEPAAEVEAAAPAEAQPATPRIEWELEPEPELDLELELTSAGVDEPAPRAARPETEPLPQAPDDAPVSFEVGLDLEELERTSYEVVPEEVPADRRLADLLAEAEVFRKYGLREKAHDRVREILQHDGQHLEALALQVTLLVEDGRHDRALPRAQQLAELAAGSEAGEAIWSGIAARLVKAGYQMEAGRPAAGPKRRKEKKDSVQKLLDDLVGLTIEPDKPKARKPSKPAPVAAPEPPP